MNIPKRRTRAVRQTHSPDWNDLRYFLAVDRAGSFSAAATDLGVTHSTVVRRVAALERSLRTRLFDRLPSGCVATPAGQELRTTAARLAEELEGVQGRLAGGDASLSGTIRVTSTDTIMFAALTRHLGEFRELHREIDLQLCVSNSFFNLTKRDADIAVRPTRTPPEHLIGRKVASLATAIYGSKKYLRSVGQSRTWGDYQWIGFDDTLDHLSQAAWLRRTVPAGRIALKTDTLLGMVHAVREGLGVAPLLCCLAESDPSLVPLSTSIDSLATDVWILTHRDLRRVARINALIDFLSKKFASERLLAVQSSFDG